MSHGIRLGVELRATNPSIEWTRKIRLRLLSDAGHVEPWVQAR